MRLTEEQITRLTSHVISTGNASTAATVLIADSIGELADAVSSVQTVQVLNEIVKYLVDLVKTCKDGSQWNSDWDIDLEKFGIVL